MARHVQEKVLIEVCRPDWVCEVISARREDHEMMGTLYIELVFIGVLTGFISALGDPSAPAACSRYHRCPRT